MHFTEVSFMKGLLLFVAIAVILGGFGVCGWLIIQKNDDLNQANAAISSANASLAAIQGRLSEAQASVTALQRQLETERADASALQVELEASIVKVAALEMELESIHALLDDNQGDIATEIKRLGDELADANADLIKLRAESAAVLAELTKIKNPQHFGSLEDLKAWLERDDTNTNPDYALLSLADKAFILQVKALRDGYLLPAAIDADDDSIYSWNIAIIGSSIYVVSADTDEVYHLANFTAPPVHPSDAIK